MLYEKYKKLVGDPFLLTAGSFICTKQRFIDGSAIINEANANSHLKNLAHELLDGIGPRLVGSPKMQQAHDWAVAKYASWGVGARNEKWGEWRGWERGVSHIDMVQSWIKTLEGTREKIILPANRTTGEPGKWPEQRRPTRKGGMD